MTWGPWLYKNDPDVGMYVQVDCEHNETVGRRARMEGFVVEKNERYVYLHNEPREEAHLWAAIRWRVWEGPEDRAVTGRRELETT